MGTLASTVHAAIPPKLPKAQPLLQHVTFFLGGGCRRTPAAGISGKDGRASPSVQERWRCHGGERVWYLRWGWKVSAGCTGPLVWLPRTPNMQT